MKELVKEFTFDAKPRDVYEFIQNNWYLEQGLDEYPDLTFSCEPTLRYRKKVGGSANETLSLIILSIYITHFHTEDTIVEGEFGEIRFMQQDKNNCKASLYIEKDPEQWLEQID